MVGTFATETYHKPDNVTSDSFEEKTSFRTIIDIEHLVDFR